MANARTGKTSSSSNGVAAALKEEMHRALSHMPGYGEHFSDEDVGIDVTNEGSDFAVYLFAREPQGLSGTSMTDAPQQWHDEMNARESAVSALRDMLMNGPNIHDTEFDNSDELYGKKGDFVAALNMFFEAKGLPHIINPLLVAEKDKADSREERLRMPEIWTKENRPYPELCESIEEAIAESAAGDDIVSSDITAKIVQLPNGKYGLSVWSMDVGSAFDKPSAGDLHWADEQQEFIDDAPGEFLQHLRALVEDGKAKEFVRDMNEFDDFGGDDEAFVFDRLEDIEAAVKSFENKNSHPKMPATGFADKHKPGARDAALLDGIKERIIDGYDDMHGLYEFQNDVTNQHHLNADERAQAKRARAEQVMEIGLIDAKNKNTTLSLNYVSHLLSGPNEASLISKLNEYAEALANKVTELDPAAKPKTTRRDYVFYKEEEEHGGEVTYLEDESGHHGLELSGQTTITAPRAVLLQAIDALAPETPNRAGGSYAIG